MSERAYMREALESKEKIVICRWDRGTGKTKFIHEKVVNIIIENREYEGEYKNIDIAIYTLNKKMKENMIKSFKKELECHIKLLKRKGFDYSEKEDYLCFSKNNLNIKIWLLQINDEKKVSIDIYMNKDYILYDNIDLYGIGINNVIDLQLGKEQTFFLLSDELKQFKVIDNSMNIPNYRKDYLNNILNKLLKEYSEVGYVSNTVKTRNDLLQQINIVYSLLEKEERKLD